MKRRDFVRKGALASGAAFIGIGGEQRRLDGAAGTKRAQDTVTLGHTGLRVTRLAQGTGTSGVGGSSNQTRGLGEQGLAYVEREYRWPVVMGKIEGLLEQTSA